MSKNHAVASAVLPFDKDTIAAGASECRVVIDKRQYPEAEQAGGRNYYEAQA